MFSRFLKKKTTTNLDEGSNEAGNDESRPAEKNEEPAANDKNASDSKKDAAKRASQRAAAPPTEGGDQEPLPKGWKEIKDKGTGRFYYWNTATNEVTWTRPKSDQSAPASSTDIAPYAPGSLSLSMLTLGTIVGEGSFGRVRLVRDNQTKAHLVLKMLAKAEVIRMKQVHHIKAERAVLAAVHHPFVVNLLGYFQDPVYLYFALEYVPGGELFSLLRRRKNFPNDVAVFYAAQVVLAFEYLHSQHYAYRDLKPENILIAKDGYLKITDFGFAKLIPDDARSFTICGTPDYLAPEIIQNRGHSTAVDWWALGILIFEMLAGYAPFASDSSYGTYKNILTGRIDYPKSFSEEAKDLISHLLNPRPAYRLGNLKTGAEGIKTHAWFSKLDWNALLAKKVVAPYIPRVKSDSDTSNFPKYSYEEKSFEPVPNDMFADFDS